MIASVIGASHSTRQSAGLTLQVRTRSSQLSTSCNCFLWNYCTTPKCCQLSTSYGTAAMVSQLTALGVKQIFVSLHPWSQAGSLTYDNMTAKELCVRQENGEMRHWGGWTLPTCASNSSFQNETTISATLAKPAHDVANCLYDPSNPRARDFLWQQLKKGYYDAGILNFWVSTITLIMAFNCLPLLELTVRYCLQTDGTEPAGSPSGGLPGDIVFYSDIETGTKRDLPSPAGFMMWPVWHAKTVADGAGKDSWSLARSAWAGSHRHNTIVWSGDISSDWATLRQQVAIGQNFQLTYPCVRPINFRH